MASQFCHKRSRNLSRIREMKHYGSHHSFVDHCHLKNQLKKWITDWETRVFKNKLQHPKQVYYSYSSENYRLINELVEHYHKTRSEEVGQDRFAWTTFTCAVIKEHQRKTQMHGARSCQINKCLYVLLWISFYLRLPSSELVKSILKEIITCTGNLRFMFSFLPGMSIGLFTMILWINPPGYEDKLCSEYFSLLDSELSQYKDIFSFSKPFLVYLVQHLTPLHAHGNSAVTLQEVLNKPILCERKYSVLTLAINQHDADLVPLLLKLGASASIYYWDSCLEYSISAERILISSINGIMGSRQFLININVLFQELTEYMDSAVSTESSFAILIRRSVLRSEMRKSNDLWSSEDSSYELNREIADQWGIGYDRPCPTLQHICKITVRQQILQADRYLLTDALETLPLPNKIIQYLNLELD